ncbi:MAG TPA: ASKHA domain-containing protein, partial [Chloroflexota bacterium]|nr:ASKHA domain-containing protein [Chloroflexota bacterium]
ISEALASRLEADGDSAAFRLGKKRARPVALTQRDVREFQLAKGAVRAGVSTLLMEAALAVEEISEVLLAGAFGSYINPASARAVGLVPPVALDRVTAVGNAAGQGAIMALLSTEMREQAVGIARSVQYVELAGRPDFMDHFMDSMALA